jgi:hypothetical protein
MLLLAGLCPGIVHAMYGAQIDSKRAEEKKKGDYDLSRFGKGKPEPEKPGKQQINEEVIAHVRELDDELERRLITAHGSGQPSADPSTAAAATSTPNQPEQSVRKLDGGPLDVPIEDAAHKKHKRFGGEFYPTETHVKQDDDA